MFNRTTSHNHAPYPSSAQKPLGSAPREEEPRDFSAQRRLKAVYREEPRREELRESSAQRRLEAVPREELRDSLAQRQARAAPKAGNSSAQMSTSLSGPSLFAYSSSFEIKGSKVAPGAFSAVGGNQTIDIQFEGDSFEENEQ
jgi:hypothetical protein